MSDFADYIAENAKGNDFSDYIRENMPKAPKNPGMDVIDSGGIGQAALEHYGNAATMGYLPHLQALAEKLTPSPTRALDEKLAAQGFDVQNAPESYVQSRDANIARLAAEGKAHPIASGAGTLAGIVGGGLLTGAALGGAAKGATLADRMISAGKTGAAMGALANPGDTEGEIDPLQATARAKNAAIGGALGVGTQGAIEALTPATQKAISWLQAKAGEKATAAIGANKRDLTKLGDQGAQKLGQQALDQGVVGPLSTPKSVLNKVTTLKQGVGQEIGGLIQNADAAGAAKIDGTKIGVDLLNDPEILSAAKTPGMGGMVAAAQKEAETLAQNGEMTLAEAHKLRMDVDKSINFNRKRVDLAPGAQEVLYKIRDGLNNAINDSINGVPGVQADALKKANRVYSALSRMQDIAQNRIAMNSANRTIGLTDTIAAVGGMAKGGPPLALALTAMNKAGRTVGSSLQATGYNAAASLFKQSPSLVAFAQRNPLVFQTLANRLALAPKNQAAEPVVDPQTLGYLQKNPALIDSIADPKIKAAVIQQLNRMPAQGH